MDNRKLKRDIVSTLSDSGEIVGVYFADTSGKEILFEGSPEVADEVISLWNRRSDLLDELQALVKSQLKAIETQYGAETVGSWAYTEVEELGNLEAYDRGAYSVLLQIAKEL